MENIKCLLGHPIHMMKLHDITEHKFDNDKENITVYKCKHCDQIITGKTNFVKAEFKNPKEKEAKPKELIRVREYQGWSLNNTNNIISFYGDETTGYLHLVSKSEINEIEKLGLLHVIKDNLNAYQGLDIYIDVYESEYNKEEDYISGEYSHYGASVNKASTYFSKYCDFKLEDAETIITIKYKLVRRYNNSSWWRFKNKRKCIIRNELSIE
jgi:hypothetical protein